MLQYVRLERDAEALVDCYFACPGAGRMPKARKPPQKRVAARKSLH